MKHILRYSFMVILAMFVVQVFAQEVTLDFTVTDPADATGKTSAWAFPAGSGNKTVEEQSFTYGNYTVKVAGSAGQGYYWHNKDHYLLFGKQGAYLTLPAFAFDVERIDIEGTSGASTGVKQNIFVGDAAVSTETTGAKDVTNKFVIADGKQAAGTIYTIKVTSNHNNQIRTIKIWKKGTAPSDEPGGGEETPYELVGAGTLDKPFTASDAIYLANKGEYSKDKVYIAGKVFKVNTKDENITKYGNIDYFISEDGKTADPSFEIYRGKYFGDGDFTVENKVKAGDDVVVYGTLKMYNKQAETAEGAVLIKLNGVKASASELVKVQTLDFTKWSAATVTNLKADAAASKTEGWSDVEKKADAEADADPTEVAKDNCFWFAGTANEDGTLSANGVVIEELKGLKFGNDAYNTNRSLAIAVNYPTTSLGNYAGPAYLWLGAKGKLCFTIPDVPAGAAITIEAESHKTTDPRGVQLKQGDTQIGDAFTPTTLASHTWTIETAGDVDVWNTNGCHIYSVKVVSKYEPEGPVTIDPLINDSDPAIVANKAALLTAINKAKAIDLAIYKPAGAQKLAEAIEAGEALLKAEGGIVAQLDAARRAILQAIDELELRAAKAEVAEKEVPAGWENMITNGNFATDDVSSFFMVEPGKGLTPAAIEDGVDQGDWHAAVVRSQDNPSQDWDTQFFIRAKEALPVGTKIHVEFDYRSDVQGSADTQSHREPTNYIHWACVGSPTFKPEWQHWSYDGTVDNSMSAEFQTIAFNLAKNKVATTFYFDNIVFWVQKPEPTPEDEFQDIIVNGNMEGKDIVNFISKSYPSTAMVPSTIVAGAGKDGSKGIVIESPAKVEQDWDSQFWIVLPNPVPAGTTIKLQFDYKASAAASVSTQAHEAPGNYIHWACCGNVDFTTEWKTFDKEFTVPTECDGTLADGGYNKNFKSIAFNLTQASDITYYIDNVKLLMKKDVIATGIETKQPAVINNEAIFDLQGRRIAQPAKGLYIKNGKKVLVK